MKNRTLVRAADVSTDHIGQLVSVLTQFIDSERYPIPTAVRGLLVGVDQAPTYHRTALRVLTTAGGHVREVTVDVHDAVQVGVGR